MSGAFEALDVAVVGGGISGLAAAHALRKAGRNVVVLEASSSFGGCIGSVRTSPYLADRGPQSFAATTALLDLVEDLGLTSAIVGAQGTASKRYIYRHGGLNAVPKSPGQFISTPLLSTGAKWRLMAEPFVHRRSDAAEESVASFVERRAGPEILDAVVAPVMSGIYAGDPSQLSARSTVPALVRFEQEYGSVMRGLLAARRTGATDARRPRTPIGFTGGNATLIDTLLNSLEGRAYAKARVTRIGQRGAGFALECQGLPEQKIEAARVVIATPAAAAADLLEPLEPSVAADLRAIQYPPIAQVVLAYPRASVRVPLDGFGFLACRGEGVRILGAVWNSAIFPGRCPEGEVLVTAFIGGATDAAVADLTDDELTRMAHGDISRIMRISDARPKVVAGFRWNDGIPQYTLGHGSRLERIAAAAARIPGLSLIGNYFHGASVGDCVDHATHSAAVIAATLA